MKLFKNIKKLARPSIFVGVVAAAALGWGVATQTNLLSQITGQAYANPPADACITTPGGIRVNEQNANVDVKLNSPCGVRTFVMKVWYAPSASGEPHNAQVLYRTSDPVKVKTSDRTATHINVGMLPAGCFYQVDLVDITNPPNGGYPIAAAVTGGNRDCTPPPPMNYACNSLTNTPGVIDQSTGNQAFTLNAASSVSNGRVVKYDYNFGDGTTASVPSGATTASAVHTYAPGNYTATVTVTFVDLAGNQVAASGPACQTAISVKPPVPVAKLTCDSLKATPGAVQANGNQSYTLTGAASAENTAITSYAFDFGDGQNDTVNTGATTASSTHTYAPGTYTARVTVNGNVTSDACTVKITVKEQPKPELLCKGLTATAGAISADGSQSYTLNASASATNVGITGYAFDFGDGEDTIVTTGATTANTTHTYAPGNYTARVTVNGDNGAKATSDKCVVKIKVEEKVNSSLVCKSLQMVAGSVNADGSQSYTLNASATADNATITKYVFNFGDTAETTVTTGAATASTTHTYRPGTWSASVTVYGTDKDGKAIQSSNVNCQKQITVKTPECKPGVPTDSPECFTYTCDAFTVTKGDNRTVSVASFNASSTNPAATLSKVVVDWGDSSADLDTTAAAVVGQQHQYATDGTYNITAVAHFTVDGQDITASGANCAKSVSYTTTTPPVTPPTVTPPTPGQPTTLVNTGAGSVIGIFAAVAAVSAIGYRFVLGRKLAN